MTLGEILTAVGYFGGVLAAVITFVRGYQRVRDDLDHIVLDVRRISEKIDRLSGIPQRLDGLEKNEVDVWKAIDALRGEVKDLMTKLAEVDGRVKGLSASGPTGGLT